MTKRGTRTLTQADKGVATLLAMQLFARFQGDEEIVTELVKHFKCSRSVAMDCVNRAWDLVWKQPQRRSLAEKQNLAELQTKEFIRKAYEEKNLGAAFRGIQHLHRLEGLLRHDPVPLDTAGEEIGEFDNRSVEELQFYRQHGCWPEEYKAPAKQLSSHDPLAALGTPKAKKKTNGKGK